MSESTSKLEPLLKQWETEERALADLRRSYGQNGHDHSRNQLRLILIAQRVAALTRLRQDVAAIDSNHAILGREPVSLPVLDELTELYQKLEHDDAWYVWRIASGIHPDHIPGLRVEHAKKRSLLEAVWCDLSTRFPDDPFVQRLAASREPPSG